MFILLRKNAVLVLAVAIAAAFVAHAAAIAASTDRGKTYGTNNLSGYYEVGGRLLYYDQSTGEFIDLGPSSGAAKTGNLKKRTAPLKKETHSDDEVPVVSGELKCGGYSTDLLPGRTFKNKTKCENVLLDYVENIKDIIAVESENVRALDKSIFPDRSKLLNALRQAVEKGCKCAVWVSMK